jgi:hypothetical protein
VSARAHRRARGRHQGSVAIVAVFKLAYGAKYPKAVTKITDDLDEFKNGMLVERTSTPAPLRPTRHSQDLLATGLGNCSYTLARSS